MKENTTLIRVIWIWSYCLVVYYTPYQIKYNIELFWGEGHVYLQKKTKQLQVISNCGDLLYKKKD